MNEKKEKKRLDHLVAEQHPHLTRNQIQSFIIQGKVRVNGQPVIKPGTPTYVADQIMLDQNEPKFVSRAGLKLEAALDTFDIDVTGKVALDAGISTGGFTDCLLQRGAKHVYGVDVGYGQVHEKIRNDKRVTLMEKTNLRYVESLPELIDIATLDLSFISLLKVMPSVSKLLAPRAIVITLIKPQFEAEREDVGHRGLIEDPRVHDRVVEKIITGMEQLCFEHQGIIESPILGASSGNKEFIAYFVRDEVCKI